MNEEIKTTTEPTPSVSGAEQPDANADYIAAIKELREKTVSKEAFEELRKKNKDLINALVRGDKIDTPAPKSANVDELRSKLFGKGSENLSNLEYVKAALELRTELMNRGERDPFLPIGTKVTDSAEIFEKAQRVADAFQECVDFAEGDSEIFTAKLQSLTKDIPFKIRR